MAGSALDGIDYDPRSAKVGADGRSQAQVLPIGAMGLADLVSAELVHGGEHRVYLKALELIVPMLG